MALALAKSATTSGVLMTVGDILCQAITLRSSPNAKLDLTRTGRFAAAGFLLHGPIFHAGFRFADKKVAALALKPRVELALKVAILQLATFPAYLAAFFPAMGMMEGRGWASSSKRSIELFPKAYTAGLCFWPFVNIVNFSYFQPSQRMVVANVAGVFFNTALSFINSSNPKNREE
ncbi:hypothetical protein NDN08_005192 [Rhodosorus marinus]|uniref:Peroxisomal membrane protein MPV17 n=1 Tax=Rhodosorus marinus TaxID=101924 RepID=A0AAV8V445_9RHOD|nr:hypothetical protein NDN08_005192 [Rhodosorus marinus]